VRRRHVEEVHEEGMEKSSTRPVGIVDHDVLERAGREQRRLV